MPAMPRNSSSQVRTAPMACSSVGERRWLCSRKAAATPLAMSGEGLRLEAKLPFGRQDELDELAGDEQALFLDLLPDPLGALFKERAFELARAHEASGPGAPTSSRMRFKRLTFSASGPPPSMPGTSRSRGASRKAGWARMVRKPSRPMWPSPMFS